MDYEKKYKEALEMAREAFYSQETPHVAKAWLLTMFPALVENENEKTRRNIIELVKQSSEVLEKQNQKDMLNWLEKQIKQKPTWSEEDEQSKNWILDYLYDGLRRSDEQFKDEFKAAIDWLDKLGEQKSTDNVEPKFHKGEWIISDTVSKDYRICKITGIKDGNYTIESTCGYKGYNQFDVFDTAYRLWTIQDAKDGDVLVDAYGNIGMFDKCYDFDWMSSCSLGNNGGFKYFTVEHENEKTYPATKEQRDLFFSKMKEAGWEWDSKNKELKKNL